MDNRTRQSACTDVSQQSSKQQLQPGDWEHRKSYVIIVNKCD